MEVLVGKASAFDFAEALDDTGLTPVRLTRRMFALYARQVSEGAAFAFRTRAGELIMLAGLYALPDWTEAWWAMGSGPRRGLLPAMRRLREILDGIGAEAAPLDVRIHETAHGVAGGRVAALLGFTDAGETSLPGFGQVKLWTRVFPPPGQG